MQDHAQKNGIITMPEIPQMYSVATGDSYVSVSTKRKPCLVQIFASFLTAYFVHICNLLPSKSASHVYTSVLRTCSLSPNIYSFRKV